MPVLKVNNRKLADFRQSDALTTGGREVKRVISQLGNISVNLTPFHTRNGAKPTKPHKPVVVDKTTDQRVDLSRARTEQKDVSRFTADLSQRISSSISQRAGASGQRNGRAPSKTNSDAGSAPRELGDELWARAAIGDLFGAAPTLPLMPGQAPASGDSAAALVDRLIGVTREGDVPQFGQSILLARLLAALPSGHNAPGSNVTRAIAALKVLQGESPAGTDPAARANAFAIQRQLARSGAGLDVLDNLAGHEALDAEQAAIRRDATMQAFKAASQLMAALPESEPQPNSLGAAVEIAHQRLKTATHGPIERTCQALVAAALLRRDPSCTLREDLREPYFSLRMGYHESGKGTPLDQTQARLFKLLTYAGRAANGRQRLPLLRVFGVGKSPLSAMQLGNQGIHLDTPEKEYQKIAIGNVIDAMRASANTTPSMQTSVRIAALQAWQAQIDQHGWHEKTTLNRSSREHIAQAAAASLLGKPVEEAKQHDAFDSTLKGVKQDPAFADLIDHPVMTTERLEAWITASALDAGLQERVARMRTLDPRGPSAPAPQHGLFDTLRKMVGLAALDPASAKVRENTETQLQHLRTLIKGHEAFNTVRYGDGGQFGVDASVYEGFPIPVPITAPALKLTKKRSAVVEAGSSAQNQVLFIGTENTWSARAGAWVGFPALHGIGAFGVNALGRDARHRKGVMLYTRHGTQGTDASREKQLKVIDCMLNDTTTGNPPASSQDMWKNIASNFYKDPDVSLGWHDDKDVNWYSGASVLGGARTPVGNWKIGLFGELDFTKTWIARAKGKDTTGAISSSQASRTSNWNLAGSLSLVATPQSVANMDAGRVRNLSTASAPIVGLSGVLAQQAATVNIDIARTERVDAGHSFKDIAFRTSKDFIRYVGAHQHEVIEGLDPPQGKSDLENWLTKVKLDDTGNNQTFILRRTMTPEAARTIDHYEAQIATHTPVTNAKDAQAVERLDALIAQTLADDKSWKIQALCSLETNSQQRANGPQWMALLTANTEASGTRLLQLLEMRA